MHKKLTSRKFWLSVAAFLASIGATIGGIATGDSAIAIMGIICTTLSTGIYAAAEAWTDTAHTEDED